MIALQLKALTGRARAPWRRRAQHAGENGPHRNRLGSNAQTRLVSSQCMAVQPDEQPTHAAGKLAAGESKERRVLREGGGAF